MGRKESNHTNLVAWAVFDHVQTLDIETQMRYAKKSTTAETRAWYAKNSLFGHITIIADVVLKSDSVANTSINNGDNLIHNLSLELEKKGLCLVIQRFTKVRLQLMISLP